MGGIRKLTDAFFVDKQMDFEVSNMLEMSSTNIKTVLRRKLLCLSDIAS
jgi:hypothetical protein